MTQTAKDQLRLLEWARDCYRDGLGDAVESQIEYLRVRTGEYQEQEK